MFTMSKTGYELLVKGGTLLDPGRAIHERRDIAFADQKVQEVPVGETDEPLDWIVSETYAKAF